MPNLDNPDYKEMYLTMCRASEEAINTIIAAQRKCEEMYISPKDENAGEE